MWISTVILSVLLEIVLSQRTPTIARVSPEQIKDIGGYVDLYCIVHFADDYPVLWLKHDESGETIPLSNDASLIIKEPRFSLRHDRATSTYTLQIKDIQERDAGIYECRIPIRMQTGSKATVKLHIRQAPFINDNSTRSIIANEGETHTLKCSAGGYPTPHITWRREDNAILPTGGAIYKGPSLTIPSVRKEDRGTYYCIAENGVGTDARRNINLEVEFKPVVTIPRPRLGQALQYDMDLECHVEAYPPPAIIWIKDGVQLSNNQHYSISHFATADEYTDSTLRVITVEKRQYGKFICKASNKHGSDEKEVVLFESHIPICPPACGHARYSNGVMPITPGPLVVITVAIVIMFKNIRTKH